MNRPTHDQLEAFRQELAKIAECDVEMLTQRDEWGAINFAAAQETIEGIREQANELVAMPLASLDVSQFSDLQASTSGITAIFAEIGAFTIDKGGDPTAERDNIISRLVEGESQRFFSAYQQHIPYLAYRRGSDTADIREIREAKADAEKLLDFARQESEVKRQELDEIISAARSAAPDAAIPSFASDFRDEAEERASQARRWLIATCAMYVLSMSVLGWLAYTVPTFSEVTDAGKVLYHLAIKLPFVAVFLTGAFWCGRHYSVAKQQEVVNRHRAHSIRTFRAFVESAHDPDVKDAVLAKAVECVFVHVPTGLTRQEGGGWAAAAARLATAQRPK